MDAQRLEWALDLRKHNNQGMTYLEWVNEYNATNGTDYTKGFACALARDLREYEAPTISAPQQVKPLESWQDFDSLPATDTWQAVQDKIEHDNRYVIIEHDNDNHFPFHDPNAQRMRSAIRRMVQPHIIVVGSDAIDAPNLSRFEPDNRLPNTSTIKTFRKCWYDHIDRINYDAPDANLVWIDGNHDARVHTYFSSYPEYAILFEHFIETVSASGRVHWRGTTIQEQEITIADTLSVVHGWKANKYTASSMLREYNNQTNIMAGHSHRPDHWRINGRYTAQALIGGCGCLLHPHYETRKPVTNWAHGYSYGIVDTLTQTCILHHVDFMHTDDTIWAWHNGQAISVEKEPIAYYETKALAS